MASERAGFGTLDTYQALVSAFVEFLTVATHLILYEREIYPKTSFLSVRKYNLAVRQNRHPKVCQWIKDAVAAVEDQLFKGVVRQTSLVIYSEDSVPLERYIFSTARFPIVPVSDALTPFEASPESPAPASVATHDEPGERAAHNQPLFPSAPMIDLAAQFRALLSRICTSAAQLAPLPEGCTFTLAIELRDKPQGQPPVGWPQPWNPAVLGLQKPGPYDLDSDVSQKGKDLGGARTTPLRTLEAGAFLMEAWVEEGQAKFAEAKTQRTESHLHSNASLSGEGSAVLQSMSPPSVSVSPPSVSVEDVEEEDL